MNEKTETVRLRYARTAAKNIIELQGQLDRPLPKNKLEQNFINVTQNFGG